MARPKNSNKNKTTVRTKQVVNIYNSRPKKRGHLSPTGGSIIRNFYHAMPQFNPIYNQPQPVGTRPDVSDAIEAITRAVIPLQEAVLNIQKRDALMPAMATPRNLFPRTSEKGI